MVNEDFAEGRLKVKISGKDESDKSWANTKFHRHCYNLLPRKMETKIYWLS